jgi:hypothetical protein
MSSMDESFNNRTMQYTERSVFQDDVQNKVKQQAATEYGKPFL